eukprot:gene15582-21681_t
MSGKESLEERLLVLGGTGNVGQYVLQWLQQHAGANVRIFVGTRTPEELPRIALEIPSVEPVVCNMSEPSSIQAAVRQAKPDRVFLCLPQALDDEAMKRSSEACASAMSSVGCPRLVRVASLGIDGGIEQGPLGSAHMVAEAQVKSLGLRLSSVRPASFHTNFIKYDLGSIRSDSCFRSPLGIEARVNWVHCRDIGQVAAALLLKEEQGSRGNEVVEVTGPPSSTLSAPEMADLLTEELGRPIRYEEVEAPPVQAYQALWAFLRKGGFDKSTDEVLRVTGNSPIDFREVVRELKSQL